MASKFSHNSQILNFTKTHSEVMLLLCTQHFFPECVCLLRLSELKANISGNSSSPWIFVMETESFLWDRKQSLNIIYKNLILQKTGTGERQEF